MILSTKGNVGFLGSFQVDFLFYCARTLSCMGKKVLVIDASPNAEITGIFLGDLKTFCASEDTAQDGFIYTQSRVDITTQEYFLREVADGHAYDFVLSYFGDCMKEEEAKAQDEIFAVTFADRIFLEHLRKQMITLQVPMHVVLRNLCRDRTLRKTVFRFLERGNAFVEEKFVVMLDEVDETYRIRFQYAAVREFREISKEMEHTVKRVLGILCPEEGRAVDAAFAGAKKGAWL